MRALITGAGGMLARAVRLEFEARGHAVVALPRERLDVIDGEAVDRVIGEVEPDVVVQCAAYTGVDDAEREESRALAVNATGTVKVAGACRMLGARLVYPSTDYVFEGSAGSPYSPDAEPSPINAYGRTKLAGEAAACAAGDWLVVRTSWLYGAGGSNFVRAMIDRGRAGESLKVVDDQRGAPTWTHTLARVFAELLEREAPSGVYHATNRGETTWHGLAVAALEAAGVRADVEPVGSDAFPRPARRPHYSVLDCASTEAVVGTLPDWREALAEAVRRGV